MKRFLEKTTYHHYLANHRRWPIWKGLMTVKYPMDMITYAELIFKHKPDYLIETGTKFGGSATFFADVMEAAGHGRVITIDIDKCIFPPHPRITVLQGNSTGKEILSKVKKIIGDNSVMVSLDSDHHRRHVKRELYYYSPLVTKDQFLVVEDIFPSQGGWVKEAIEWFLRTRWARKFQVVPLQDKYLYSSNIWLQRR